MTNLGFKNVDWLNASSLPKNPLGAFEAMSFNISCGGGSHVVRWDPDGRATTEAHGDAGSVVVALGAKMPVCVRFADLMNRGLLTKSTGSDGVVSVGLRWDVGGVFEDPEEKASFFNGLVGLPN